MAISKQTVTLADNITERGQINVKTITRVLEDGNLLSEAVHRKVLNPGDSLTGEADQVAAVANAVWTPEVIAAWLAGNPVPEQDWRPQANIDRDAYRDRILNVLNRLLALYTAAGDAAKVSTVASAMNAVAILGTAGSVKAVYDDLTKTRADYDAAVKARWLEIVAPAPPSVKQDFYVYGGNTV